MKKNNIIFCFLFFVFCFANIYSFAYEAPLEEKKTGIAMFQSVGSKFAPGYGGSASLEKVFHNAHPIATIIYCKVKYPSRSSLNEYNTSPEGSYQLSGVRCEYRLGSTCKSYSPMCK